MAYCRKCGQKNPDNSAFCFACGTPLRKDSTSQESESTSESGKGATPERLNIPSQREDEPQTFNNGAPKENGMIGGVVGFIKNRILTIGVCVVAAILLFWVYKSCTAMFNSNESTTEKLVNADEQETDFDDDFETDVTTWQETEPESDSEVEENMEPITDEEPAVEIEVEEEEAEEIVVDEPDIPKEDKTTTKATTNTTDTRKVYDIVEQMPSYPGGQSAMMSFLSRNIVYPEAAQKRGAQGIVTISFVVEPDGSLTNFKVLRSVDIDLAKESLRVVKMMPRWQPGKKDGKLVRVRYTVPITFKF